MSDIIATDSDKTMGIPIIARTIIERHLERKLKDTEIVHHLNEISDDDRTANLAVFIDTEHHAKFHRTKRKSQYARNWTD